MTMDSNSYQDSTTKSNYFKTRTMSDPHYTKWSDYKKPEWYHPYNGKDWRAEYMYTRQDNDDSPYMVMAENFFGKYRAFLYLLLFGLTQVFTAFRSYAKSRVEEQEMQIL